MKGGWRLMCKVYKRAKPELSPPPSVVSGCISVMSVFDVL